MKMMKMNMMKKDDEDNDRLQHKKKQERHRRPRMTKVARSFNLRRSKEGIEDQDR